MTVDKQTKKSTGLSRRSLLGGAGRLALGAAAGAAAANLVSRPARAADTVPAWPWPYKKLDPNTVYQHGHDAYFKYGCCEAAFDAITGELGAPFTSVPRQMFKWGEGGVAGWGNLCGALNGSCAAIALVHGDTDITTKMINDLMTWYEQAHGSGSTLCHASVTGWCQQTGLKAESDERKERCAGVAGDTAASAVEMLNRQADEKYQQTSALSSTVNLCMSCHGKGAQENTRGKMDCVPCHTAEPHKTGG